MVSGMPGHVRLWKLLPYLISWCVGCFSGVLIWGFKSFITDLKIWNQFIWERQRHRRDNRVNEQFSPVPANLLKMKYKPEVLRRFPIVKSLTKFTILCGCLINLYEAPLTHTYTHKSPHSRIVQFYHILLE